MRGYGSKLSFGRIRLRKRKGCAKNSHDFCSLLPAGRGGA